MARAQNAVAPLVQPYFPVPEGLNSVQRVYGDLDYVQLSGGAIEVSPVWERDSLVTLHHVCGLKGLSIRLHHRLAGLFERCLAEAVAKTGYRVERLSGFRPHLKEGVPGINSWGAGFEVNWHSNGRGRGAKMDLPAVFIATFTDQGFEWGGNDRDKDYSHFRYATNL